MENVQDTLVEGASVNGLPVQDLSVADIRSGLANKEFSAAELAQAFEQRIACVDKDIHAFLDTTPDMAKQSAAKIDKLVSDGATEDELPVLAGVPCAFKDNMNLIGTHTTCASAMLENYVSPYTATCVQKAIDAGCLPFGKTNMDEFAFGSSTETSYFGTTKNPWDLERVPGGSSGGSAAVVASGQVCVSLGSDTGGSIRQPASFCGCVGYKPSYGFVSRQGIVAFGSSLDQVGPFGKSVEDVAYVMNAIAGRDVLDCTSQKVEIDFTQNLNAGIKGFKVGVVPALLELPGLSAEVKASFESCVSDLKGAGAEIIDIELPHAESSISAYYVLGPCEAFSNLSRFDSVRYGLNAGGAGLEQREDNSRAQGFGMEAKRRILLGAWLLASGVYDKYYLPAQKVRTLITQDYTKAFEQVNAIILPAAPRTAFKFGEIADPAQMYLSDVYTISLNIAGNGGMSLPVGLGSESGLPIGLQIIGPQFGDAYIFQLAAELERLRNCERLPKRYMGGAGACGAASGDGAGAAGGGAGDAAAMGKNASSKGVC